MNILVADFLFVEAHRNINLSLIKAMARENKLAVLSVNGYYDGHKTDLGALNIKVIDVSIEGDRNKKFKGKLYIARLMKMTASLAKKDHYDLIVSLAYDTIATAIGCWFLNGFKVALFNHKNIDELANKIHRNIFHIYKNRFIHFTFDESFRDYLKKEHCVTNVFYIPHPVPIIGNLHCNVKSYDCVALCNSNDETLISWLDSHHDILKEKNITFLIRTKCNTLKNKSNIEYLKTYIEYEEYDSLIKNAKSVLVPLPTHYKYRLSGSIYDALSRYKPVITTSKFHADSLNRKYPGLCIFIAEPEDIIYTIEQLSQRRENFINFINDHTEESASRYFSVALKALNSKV